MIDTAAAAAAAAEQVVTTFELPGYIDMWTVVGCTSVDEQHAFMILSQEDSTMVCRSITHNFQLRAMHKAGCNF